MAHDQNVLLSLTEDEARLLRSILANGLERSAILRPPPVGGFFIAYAWGDS